MSLVEALTMLIIRLSTRRHRCGFCDKLREETMKIINKGLGDDRLGNAKYHQKLFYLCYCDKRGWVSLTHFLLLGFAILALSVVITALPIPLLIRLIVLLTFGIIAWLFSDATSTLTLRGFCGYIGDQCSYDADPAVHTALVASLLRTSATAAFTLGIVPAATALASLVNIVSVSVLIYTVLRVAWISAYIGMGFALSTTIVALAAIIYSQMLPLRIKLSYVLSVIPMHLALVALFWVTCSIVTVFGGYSTIAVVPEAVAVVLAMLVPAVALILWSLEKIRLSEAYSISYKVLIAITGIAATATTLGVVLLFLTDVLIGLSLVYVAIIAAMLAAVWGSLAILVYEQSKMRIITEGM